LEGGLHAYLHRGGKKRLKTILGPTSTSSHIGSIFKKLRKRREHEEAQKVLPISFANESRREIPESPLALLHMERGGRMRHGEK